MDRIYQRDLNARKPTSGALENTRLASSYSCTAAFMLAAAAMALTASATWAQTFPTRPVRIVTAPVGGSADVVARLVGQGISGPLGQTVVIDNRPTTLIGPMVSKAPPDGYTLGLVGQNFWVTPLTEKTSYDPIADFSGVTLTNRSPNLLVVHPSLPVKSVKELIALAKAHPGELNYAGTGQASTSTLAAELLKSMAGIKMTAINFSGGGPAMTSLLSGEVQVRFLGEIGTVLKSGRLRALAITSEKPSALAPGLPTVAETIPGYVSEIIQILLAPAKTPDPVIARLNQEIVRFLNRPEVKEQLFVSGSEAAPTSPEEAMATMKADSARMGKVIKDLGLAH